jgi:hypothetical protein
LPDTSRSACAFRRAAVFRWIAPRAAERSSQETSGAQPPRERLRRRAVAQVLEPLLSGGPDALFLLLDVRHVEKTPASRGRVRW